MIEDLTAIDPIFPYVTVSGKINLEPRKDEHPFFRGFNVQCVSTSELEFESITNGSEISFYT